MKLIETIDSNNMVANVCWSAFVTIRVAFYHVVTLLGNLLSSFIANGKGSFVLMCQHGLLYVLTPFFETQQLIAHTFGAKLVFHAGTIGIILVTIFVFYRILSIMKSSISLIVTAAARASKMVLAKIQSFVSTIVTATVRVFKKKTESIPSKEANSPVFCTCQFSRTDSETETENAWDVTTLPSVGEKGCNGLHIFIKPPSRGNTSKNKTSVLEKQQEAKRNAKEWSERNLAKTSKSCN